MGVRARATVDLNQVVGVIQNKLVVVDALAHWWSLGGQAWDLGNSPGPAVLEGLTEQLGEVVHVLRTHQVGLVPLGLQPLLGRVRRRNWTQVHGTKLVGTADAVEDPLALLRLLLDVQLHLNDETVGVGDDHTQRVGHAGGRVSAEDTDLSASDTQSPQTTTKSFQETSQSLLHIVGLQVENGREVDEDVVKIRVVVSNDLQGVQDIVHQPISL